MCVVEGIVATGKYALQRVPQRGKNSDVLGDILAARAPLRMIPANTFGLVLRAKWSFR